MDAVARNMAASFSWWSGPPTGADADLDLWASDAAREGMAVFAMGSMGYYVPGLPAEDWRDVGRKLVEAMTYFFFGPWRDRFTYLGEQFNRERARAELPWIGCYREGLAVALSLGDWASADRLLEWPDSDLRFDEGSDDRTREDNAYQIWLALRLRGEQGNRVSAQRDVANRQLRREGDLSAAKALRQVKTLLPNTDAISAAVFQREAIARGSRRRPKMLLAAAEALLAGNPVEMSKALTAYLRHYRQREIRPNRVDFGVSLDGTILWHLARRRQLPAPELSEDLMALIARP